MVYFNGPIWQFCFCLAEDKIDGLAISEVELREIKIAISFSG